MNLVTLIGRLGQDPDVRVMQNSEKVAALSIATTEKWTDKQTGVKKESTEWHRVVLYRRLAEIAELYVKKGIWYQLSGKLKPENGRIATVLSGVLQRLLPSRCKCSVVVRKIRQIRQKINRNQSRKIKT